MHGETKNSVNKISYGRGFLPRVVFSENVYLQIKLNAPDKVVVSRLGPQPTCLPSLKSYNSPEIAVNPFSPQTVTNHSHAPIVASRSLGLQANRQIVRNLQVFTNVFVRQWDCLWGGALDITGCVRANSTEVELVSIERLMALRCNPVIRMQGVWIIGGDLF